MSWKPGTRVVRVQSIAQPEQVGMLATVIDESLHRLEDRAPINDPACALLVRYDTPVPHARYPNGRKYATWKVYPEQWRKLPGNDTTGITTVADLVRSLKQPQGVQA